VVKRVSPKVSIIISNRNDVAMLAVTVRSCIEELRPLSPMTGEIVIVDNSDSNIYEMVNSAIPSGYVKDGVIKVIHQNFPCLFTARETAASNASGEYILCIDSHVLIGRNMIVDLVNFMDRRSDDPTLAFAHAPICWAHHHERNSKHDRDMSKNELGDWNLAYPSERTITWKGMPWICRREWFLDRDKGLNGYGALAEHRMSWGGGDMHIGIKPWLLGFKNWAVPTSPCIHIGPFPKIDTTDNPNETKVCKNPDGYRYRLYSTSGSYPHALGFLVSCYVLDGEVMMRRNKKAISERFGRFIDVDKWWLKAIEFGSNERHWLDERKKMSFHALLALKPWNQDCLEIEQTA
jgi:glycosyltransferase involved in cell wall biosynthesis